MKRTYALVSVLVIFSFLLVACGSSLGNTSGNGHVTINWWHVNTQEPLKSDWQNLANQYMKSHPNVTINVNAVGGDAFTTKLTAALQAGTPPDLFQSWGGGGMQTYAKAGLLKDITSSVNDGWGATFSPAALKLYDYNGKFYGVPWDIGAVGFWYNPALFAKAGITGTPSTWDDFLTNIKMLKAAGITPIALGEKDAWVGAFWWEYLAIRLGGQAAFDKAYAQNGSSFTDPAFVEAGTYMQQLAALHPFENGFLGLSYNDHTALMGNGKAAMELMGQWGPANDADASTDKKGVPLSFFPFPSIPGGAGNPTDVLGGAQGFAVGKNAPPETIDFLKFLTSATHQSMMAAQAGAPLLPSVKAAGSAVTDPNALAVVKLVQNANYFQLYYDQYMTPAVGLAVNNATQALFAGQSTPQATAQTINAAVASGK